MKDTQPSIKGVRPHIHQPQILARFRNNSPTNRHPMLSYVSSIILPPLSTLHQTYSPNRANFTIPVEIHRLSILHNPTLIQSHSSKINNTRLEFTQFSTLRTRLIVECH